MPLKFSDDAPRATFGASDQQQPSSGLSLRFDDAGAAQPDVVGGSVSAADQFSLPSGMGLVPALWRYVRNLNNDDPADDLSVTGGVGRVGDIASDVGVSLARGVAGLVGMVGTGVELAAGREMPSDSLGKRGLEGARESSQLLDQYDSPELRARKEGAKAAIDAEPTQLRKAARAFWEYISDPVLLTNFLAEQSANLGAAGILTRAGKVGSLALGATEKTAAKVATGVGSATGIGMTAADAGSGTIEELRQLPDAIWEEAPGMDSLLESGLSWEEAKQQMIMDLAQKAAVRAGAVSAATLAIPGAQSLEKLFAGAPGIGGRMLRAGKGALGEGAQQGIEEGGTALATGLSVQSVDPKRDPKRGVGAAAGQGAIFGLFGLSAGLGRSLDDIRQDQRAALELMPVDLWRQVPSVAEAERTGGAAALGKAIRDAAAEMTAVSSEDDTPLSLIREAAGGRLEPVGADRAGMLTEEQRGVFSDLLNIHPDLWAQHPDVAEQVAAGIDPSLAVLGVAGRLAGSAKPGDAASGLFRAGFSPGQKVSPVLTVDTSAVPSVIDAPTVEDAAVAAAEALDKAAGAGGEADGQTDIQTELGVMASVRAAIRAAREVIAGNKPDLDRIAGDLRARFGDGVVQRFRAGLERRLSGLTDLRNEIAGVRKQKTKAHGPLDLAHIINERLRLGANEGIIEEAAAGLDNDDDRQAFRDELTSLRQRTRAAGEGAKPPRGVRSAGGNAQPLPLTPGSAIGGTSAPPSPPSPPSQGAATEGVTPPAPAPAASKPIPRIDLDTADTSARTEAGREVKLRYAWVSLSDLIPSHNVQGVVNPGYPQSRQPRNRATMHSRSQMIGISKAPDPARLSRSARVGPGAPIIDESGVVEVGNGRVAGLQEAARSNPEGYAAYRAGITEQALSSVPEEQRAEILARMDSVPDGVLVAIRQTPLSDAELVEYTQSSNRDDTLEMSDAEQAQADARRMSPDLVSLYQGGDLLAEDNDRFVRAFVSEVVGASEAVMTASGTLSRKGLLRIQAALLARGYGDPDLVAALIDDPETSIAGIGGALQDVAGLWARLRDGIESGAVDPAMNMLPALLAAVGVVRKSRATGTSVFDLVNQLDMLTGKTPLDDLGAGFLGLMFRDTTRFTRPVSRKRLAEALDYVARASLSVPPGGDLLGGGVPVPEDLLKASQPAGAEEDANESKTDATAEGGAGPAEKPAEDTGTEDAGAGESGKPADGAGGSGEVSGPKDGGDGGQGGTGGTGGETAGEGSGDGATGDAGAGDAGAEQQDEAPADEPTEGARIGEWPAQVVRDLRAAIIDKFDDIRDNPSLKAVVAGALGKEASAVTPVEIKLAQELYEFALVERARQIMAVPIMADSMRWQALRGLYAGQPNLNVRTLGSKERQAYSTPLPLAFIASRLAEAGDAFTSAVVLEPTAGNGALLIGVKPPAFVNELDDLRRDNLRSAGYAPTGVDALRGELVPMGEDGRPLVPIDVVLANPPFGPLKTEDRQHKDSERIDGYLMRNIDHAIAARALNLMKPDGIGVLILGADGLESVERSTASTIFLNWLYAHYNVGGHFEISGSLYTRQGAQWPIRVITVEGRRAEPDPKALPPKPEEITRHTQWDDAYAAAKSILDTRDERQSGAADPRLPAPGPRPDTEGERDQDGLAPGETGGTGGGQQPKRPGGRRTGGRKPRVRDGRSGERSGGATEGAPTTGDGRGGATPPPSEQPPADTGTGGRGDTAGDPGADLPPVGGGGTAGGSTGGVTGADNTLITADKYAELLEQMKRKMRDQRAGFDPELFSIGMQMATYWVEAGARKFVEVARRIAADLGVGLAKLKQYIAGWYNGARNMLAESGLSTEGMDSEQAVIAQVDVLDQLMDQQPPADEAPPAPGPADTATEGTEEEAPDREAREEAAQVPYISRAWSDDEEVLIPGNLADPTHRALANLETEVGSLSDFVKAELGYADDEAVRAAFMALQVDAVAAAIQAAKNNRAIVIADQTGIGKGRQAAAVIRWGLKNGRLPIFITEKPNLFTDMFDDLADIGTPVSDIRPFVVNVDAVLKPNALRGRVIAPGATTRDAKAHRAEIMQIAGAMDGAKLPRGANFVMMTYSQLGLRTGTQRPMLQALTSGGNALFVLDESHNMAGEIEVWDSKAKTMQETTAGFLQRVIAGVPVLYLSATYAKRPDNLPAYARTDLGYATETPEGLKSAFDAGGLALLSAASAQLAQSGQLFRRERSFKGIDIPIEILPDTDGQHRMMADTVTERLRALVIASSMFSSAIPLAYANAMGMPLASSGGNQPYKLTAAPFASVVHNYVRQLLLAINTAPVIEQALEALRNGEKVVIALEATNESFLSEVIDQDGLSVGDEIRMDYRRILKRAVDRSRRISITTPMGDKMQVEVSMNELRTLNSAVASLYDTVYELVENMPELDGLPVSPIDAMREAMEAAGFKTSEITGRASRLLSGPDGTKIVAARSVAERDDRRGTVDKFNGGTVDRPLPQDEIVDALVINAAGSTGLSAHASAKFGDRRPRRMIVAQLMLNVNTLVQALGRINRTGQVELPRYSIRALDIPAQRRPLSVAARKLKSLNANTSGSQRSVTSIEAPDMFNKYGDLVATNWALINQEWMRLIGVAVPSVQVDGDGNATSAEPDLAETIFSHLAILPSKTQEIVIESLESSYQELIEYLDATGQNDLEIQQRDLRATILKSALVYEGNNDNSPVFGGDAVLHVVSAYAHGKYLSPVKVRSTLAEAIGDRSTDEMLKENLTLADRGHVMVRNQLEDAVSKANAEIARMRAANNGTQTKEQKRLEKQVQDMNERLAELPAKVAALKDQLRTFAVGSRHKLSFGEGANVAAIVYEIGLEGDPEKGNPLSPSRWKVRVLMNDTTQKLRMTLATISKPDMHLAVAKDTSDEWIDRAFPLERAKEGVRQEEVRGLVTGNLIGGYNGLAKVGRRNGIVTTFTDAKGSEYQGILLPRGSIASLMQTMEFLVTARISDDNLIMRALVRNPNDELLVNGYLGIRARNLSDDADDTRRLRLMLHVPYPLGNRADHKQVYDRISKDQNLRALAVGGDMTIKRREISGYFEGRDRAFEALRMILRHSSPASGAQGGFAMPLPDTWEQKFRAAGWAPKERGALDSFDGVNKAPTRETSVQEEIDLTEGLFDEAGTEGLEGAILLSGPVIVWTYRAADGTVHSAAAMIDAEERSNIDTKEQQRVDREMTDFVGGLRDVRAVLDPTRALETSILPEHVRIRLVSGTIYANLTKEQASRILEMGNAPLEVPIVDAPKSADDKPDAMKRDPRVQTNPIVGSYEVGVFGKGRPEHQIALSRRVSYEDYKRILEIAEKHGGTYDKKRGSKWYFQTGEGAANWLAEISGDIQFAAVPPALKSAPKPGTQPPSRTAIMREIADAVGLVHQKTGFTFSIIHSSDIPPHVQRAYDSQIGSKKQNDAGMAGWYRGKHVVLVYDRFQSVHDAVRFFAHETFGHAAMEELFGNQWPLIERLVEGLSIKDPRVRAIKENVARRYPGVNKTTFAKEFIAVAAEFRTLEGPMQTFMRTVRETVRQILRALGFKLPFSQTDIDTMLTASQRYARTGERSRVHLGALRVRNDEALNASAESHAAIDRPDSDDVSYAFFDPNQMTPDQYRAIQKAGFGSQTTGVPLVRRLAKWIAHPKMAARQYWLDSYESFRTLLEDKEAWWSGHLSKGTSSAMEAAIEFGQLYLHQDGVLQVDTNKEGLREILEPLGLETDRFLAWIAGNRAERLWNEGRERLLGLGDIADLKTLNEDGNPGDPGYMPGRKALYEETYAKFKLFHESIVQIAVDTGLIGEEEAEIWKEEGYYVPFYRVLEDEPHNGPPVMSNPSLVRQEAYRALKGGTQQVAGLVENVLGNWNHLLSASMKNRAARLALQQAVGMGLAARTTPGSKRSIWVRVDGKPVWYETADTLEGAFILDSLVAFNTNDFRGIGWRIMRKMKRALTLGVTVNPAFKAANFYRDSITALAVTDVKKNPFSNIKEGWAATDRDNPIYAQMLASGAIFAEAGYIHGADPEVLRWMVSRGINRNTILDKRMLLKRYFDSYQDFGTRMENVNRAARYLQGAARGESLLQAAFEARDLLDFTRTGSGYIARALAQTVEFINARFQGLDKFGRAAFDPHQKMQWRWIALRYAGLSVLASLLAYMSDDDEWNNAEEYEKDAYHLIPLPGQAMIRIPRAFELGALATVAERIVEQMLDDEADGKLFADRMIHMLLETFSANIIPLTFKPPIEVFWKDSDFFTERPIEGNLGPRGITGGVSPEYRYKWQTSETAKWLGGVMSDVLPESVTLSPLQIDHIAEGYLGWMGGAATWFIDLITSPLRDGEAPDSRITDTVLIERFLRSGEPRSTKYRTAFYEIHRELQRLNNDSKVLLRDATINPAAIPAMENWINENIEDLGFLQTANQLAAAQSEAISMQNAIRANIELSGEEKAAQIDEINRSINEGAKGFVQSYKAARAAR